MLTDAQLGRYEADPNSGCWLWTGSLTKGYGKLGVGGKVLYAHRVFNEMSHGPIPDGVKICHRCDTPACVNPAHTFRGSQKDNLADAVSKGRHRAGRWCGRLTEDQVRQIRSDHRKNSVIAAAYKVSRPTVSLIKRRRIWKWVTDKAA